MGLNCKARLQIQASLLSSGLPVILTTSTKRVAFLQLVKDDSLTFFIHFFVGFVNFSLHLLSVYYISITCSALWGKSEGEEIVIIADTL